MGKNVEEDKSGQLYVPVNIKTRYEPFEGFGMAEIGICGAVGAAVIAFLFHAAGGEVYRSMLTVLVSVSATAMAVRKNEMNQSFIDMLRVCLKFLKSQKKYNYEYKTNTPLFVKKEEL